VTALKIKTTFNGREMKAPADLRRALMETVERDLRAAAMEDVRARAGRVRCRVHGRRVRLSFRGTGSRGVECDVDACCSELTEAVRKAID
jgi:hypothetical protein